MQNLWARIVLVVMISLISCGGFPSLAENCGGEMADSSDEVPWEILADADGSTEDLPVPTRPTREASGRSTSSSSSPRESNPITDGRRDDALPGDDGDFPW